MSENLPAVLSAQQMAILEESGPTDDFGARDLMIPSLRILQANSRETKRSTPEYVEGAREGLFYINVTRQMFEKLSVIPVKYQHVVREFASGDLNAKIVADHGTNLDVLEGLERDDRGRYMRPDSQHVLVESALYFVIALTSEGPVPCALRMGSTQWRKARRWNTIMQNFEMKNPATGKMFRPPMYARSYIFSARSEANTDNSWFGYHIEPGELTQNIGGDDLLLRARDFRRAADTGKAHVVEDAAPSQDSDSAEPRQSAQPSGGAGLNDEIPF